MSILRPEKRDPNYIRNKSDIGLSKVDNVSSAEFASIVLDQVRRYLNRETIYQTLGRRFIALAKISCKDDGSGNLVKILSGNLFITFAVLNESEEIREAVKLETIYTHYIGNAETGETEVDYSDDVAKVEYNIFKADSRDLSTLLNECYLEFRENTYEDAKGTTVVEMYVILRCDAENLPFVSVNLFEYSNGGTVLDPTILDDATLASYTLIRSAKLDHNRFSLVDRSEATIGFEIYDDAGNPFRVIENHPDPINPDFDIPKINGVPFTGRKGVFVEGRNTRQIEINAKHTGSSLLEAGEHDWEVIKYAPRAGHTYLDGNNVLRDNTYPQSAAFLDKDSFVAPSSNQLDSVYEKYGYGLCRLSGCGGTMGDGILLANRMLDQDMSLTEKLVFLYEWSDSLSKVDTDVIPVRVFKTFVDSTTALLSEYLKKIKELSTIVSGIPGLNTNDVNKLKEYPAAPEALGYHYIFDYANTADSVTIVPHTGMEDKKCEIKLGVVGNGDGASLINIAQDDPYEAGGNTEWVRVADIDRTRDESATVSFSFSPNKTNSSRYGYYIINSNCYSSDGSRIKLVYRFYQDVITSTLRVKYVDENQYSEFYGLGAVVKKVIENEGDILTFDNICVVDNSILDEGGEPSRIDRILGYNIDNRYDTSGVSIKEIRNEEGNRILGFQATFPKNSTNDEKKAEIHITHNNVDILVLQLVQSPRDFEFTAPDSITVGGYADSIAPFEITSNKDWIIEVVKGSSYITILNNSTGDGENGTYSGDVPDSADERTFKRKIKVLKNNTSEKATELAILKLYADGDGSKFKRITIFQNGQPAIANIGTTQINIPYYEGGETVIDDFYCTYDWVLDVDSDLAEWCEITPESGTKTGDVTNPNYTPITLKAKKTTTSVNNETRGTFTIKYAKDNKGNFKETTISVVQDKAGFEFSTTAENDAVSLNYSKDSSVKVDVTSNYDWTIELNHTDPNNKRFSANVDNIAGNTSGVSGSSIYIKALEDSTSDTQDTKLGNIKIYSLGQIVKEISVYQNKVGISISLSKGSNAGWYANGDSKQSGTSVTIPVTISPASGKVTATYTIDGGLPAACEVNDTDTQSVKSVVIPGPGNNGGNKERKIKVTATVESNGLTKDDTCEIVQNGYTNGIRVNDTTDYYGGTRTNIESTVNFGPIAGSRSFSTIYKPIPVTNKLSVTKPDWLTISTDTSDSTKDTYLLRTRSTNSTNSSGKDRTGKITITSGSDRDKTVIEIPVKQYSGTWYFGEKDKKWTEYNDKNPYQMTVEALGSSEATLEFLSYYTYASSTEKESLSVEFTEACDWCTVTCGEVAGSTGKYNIVFKSKTANTGVERSATAKVTQGTTGSVCYLKITQKAAATLNVYGGVNSVLYFLTTSSVDRLELTETLVNSIKKNATTWTGKSGSGLVVSYNNIGDVVVYESSSKSCKKISSIGITSGTKLYVNTIEGKTIISNKYCEREAVGRGDEYITLNGGNKRINLQKFGTSRIEFGPDSYYPNYGSESYDFILTNTSTNGYWDIYNSGVIWRNDYITTVSSYESATSTGFTVNEYDGVGYFHNGSMTTPAYTKSEISLYIWRRKTDSTAPGRDWVMCGYVDWDPMLTQCTIIWNHINDPI